MQTTALTTQPITALAAAGQIANEIAGQSVFVDYQVRKAANTLKRQGADLDKFAAFLAGAGLTVGNLPADPAAWAGVTWGLIEGFKRHLLAAGYAVGSVNVILATVKTYAGLASQAGAIPAGELALIKQVKGYKHGEAVNVDQQRAAAGQAVRRSTRSNGATAAHKLTPTSLTKAQAKTLKTPANETGQARRDALLMALLLDHGLRISEAAALEVGNFDLTGGTLTFYRSKVHLTQTHKLTPATIKAVKAYFKADAPVMGNVWRQSNKAGKLTGQGMTAHALTLRVTAMGLALGIVNLSAHDCRHYWATAAARNGTQLDRLMDAGGWSSLAMPQRYLEAARISNSGVKLDDGGD